MFFFVFQMLSQWQISKFAFLYCSIFCEDSNYLYSYYLYNYLYSYLYSRVVIWATHINLLNLMIMQGIFAAVLFNVMPHFFILNFCHQWSWLLPPYFFLIDAFKNVDHYLICSINWSKTNVDPQYIFCKLSQTPRSQYQMND